MMEVHFKKNHILSELATTFAKANRKSNYILVVTYTTTIIVLFIMLSLLRGRTQADGIKRVRENGSAATVILENGSEEQYQALSDLSYVNEVGAIKEFGYCYEEGRKICSCNFITEQDFQKMLHPAYENLKGTYPQNADEVMLSTRFLEKLGIEEPEIGMKIPLYIVQSNWIKSGAEDIQSTFYLSGYYTDYISDLEKLPASYFSESFLNKYEIQSFPAQVFVKSNQLWISRTQIEKQFYQDVKLEINQNFRVINEGISQSLQSMAGGFFIAAAVMILILLSMILLIYNIFSISIDRYKKQYGLLKVVGATPKQIKSIFLLQSINIMVAGSISGAILGVIFVQTIVPGIIEKMYLAGMGSAVRSEVFSIKLLILSIGLAGLGVLAAFSRCIHTIIKLSPIECLRSESTQSKEKITATKKEYRLKRGMSILEISWRNFNRNRKKNSITIFSLFLSSVVFLLSVVIINGLDRTNQIEQNPDFEVGVTKEAVAKYIYMNNGRANDETVGHELLPEELISDMKESIVLEPQSLRECIGSYGVFSRSSKAMGPRIYSYQNESEIITELTLQVVSDEWIKKLDQYINKNKIRIDLDTFQNANGFLLLHSNELSEGQEREAEKVMGQHLSGHLFQDGGKKIELICCGYLDTAGKGFPKLNMPWRGKNLNYIIISSKTMKTLNITPVTYQVSFDVAKDSERKTKSILQNILAEANQQDENDSLYYLTANSEVLAKEQSYIFATRLVMATFCGILLIFAVFSYCNTVISDMVVRRMEFAVMQSLGMTKKQLLNMLIGEGYFFIFFTLILLGSAGSIIISMAGAVMKIKIDYFVFQFPLTAFLIFAIILIIICITIPIFVYYGAGKESTIERLINAER